MDEELSKPVREYANTHGSFTAEDVSLDLGVGISTVEGELKRLVQADVLVFNPSTDEYVLNAGDPIPLPPKKESLKAKFEKKKPETRRLTAGEKRYIKKEIKQGTKLGVIAEQLGIAYSAVQYYNKNAKKHAERKPPREKRRFKRKVPKESPEEIQIANGSSASLCIMGSGLKVEAKITPTQASGIISFLFEPDEGGE